MSDISIIVATDLHQGIGIRNQLPWHLPEDLIHFKNTTNGHTIIMGRKTFDSIGRVLPNRRHIVITRNKNWSHEGVEVVTSLEDAVMLSGNKPAFIIGGMQIYQQSVEFAHKLIVTEIGKEFECDAFFPSIDKNVWKETGRANFISVKSQLPFAIVTYDKFKQ
jgi:dihydrofolate reductase